MRALPTPDRSGIVNTPFSFKHFDASPQSRPRDDNVLA
jgi:hypothetical protein